MWHMAGGYKSHRSECMGRITRNTVNEIVGSSIMNSNEIFIFLMSRVFPRMEALPTFLGLTHHIPLNLLLFPLLVFSSSTGWPQNRIFYHPPSIIIILCHPSFILHHPSSFISTENPIVRKSFPPPHLSRVFSIFVCFFSRSGRPFSIISP